MTMEKRSNITDIKLNAVNLTKTEQVETAKRFVERVLDGEVNPIDAIVSVKAVVETCNNILKDKDMVEAVINEANKYGNGEYPSYEGAKVAIRETGVKYDYSECGDDQLESLYRNMELIKEQIKEREKFLMGLPADGFDFVDPDTGEVRKLHRPSKSSTTAFAITFKK